MLASERAGEVSGFELNAPPSRHVKRTARTVAALSLLVFVCLAPFARVPLMPVPAFVPIYESALVLNDLFTAGLLLGQVVITRSRALLVLACGYLFTAMLTVGHMLTFPGLFAAQGLLGAGQQSTAWIYMFWHAGFPLSVLAYAFLRDRAGAAPPQGVSLRMIGLVIGATLGVASACVVLATAEARWLPAIMAANHYTPVMLWVAGTTWSLCVAALWVLWQRKPHATIDIWLMVVLCVWVCDVALSAVFNAGRFDLGFYAGRIYGLLAASFVLLLLLIEQGVLYARLSAALAELKRLAITDPLTGVANRRGFEAALANAWRYSTRTGTPLSLLMIDVDCFKAFNDAYGHAHGDHCLTAVSACLSRNARRSGDLVARCGGEEFYVLLPDLDAVAAAQAGQSVCDTVVALGIAHVKSTVAPYVTVSVGVATFVCEPGAQPSWLTETADRALYAAKVAGRNRVVSMPLASRPVPQAPPVPAPPIPSTSHS